MVRIGFVSFPGFAVMSFSAMAVFETANRLLPDPHYDIRLLSERGGAVRSSLGVTVETEAIGTEEFDTMVIGGGWSLPFTPGLLECLRRAARSCRRLVGSATGAFFLAEAGLLDGLRATTHWRFADQFKARYPRVKLEPGRIFVIDGSMWTSAGMTAGIDQALTMVERDLGREVATDVSKTFVLHSRRNGGQPQSSVLLDLGPRSDRIQDSLIFARRNIHAALTVARLAEAARLSPRQFSRSFRTETGVSPAKAVEMLRIEAADVLIRDGRLSIEDIARQTGFRDRERMRRAFLRSFGKSPQMVRRIARCDEDIPVEGFAEPQAPQVRMPPGLDIDCGLTDADGARRGVGEAAGRESRIRAPTWIVQG